MRFKWGRFLGVVFSALLIVQTSALASFAPMAHAQGTGNGTPALDVTTAQAWFTGGNWDNDRNNDNNGIQIKVNTSTSPPTILIPGDPTTKIGRPALQFTLTNVAGTSTDYKTAGLVAGGTVASVVGLASGGIGFTAFSLITATGGVLGSGIGSNVAWTIFTVNSANFGTIPISNLYIIGDNKGPNWVIVYGTAANINNASNTTVGVAQATHLADIVTQNDQDNNNGDGDGSGGADPKVGGSYNNLYRFLFNRPPKSGDDSCSNGTALKTGPSSTPTTLPLPVSIYLSQADSGQDLYTTSISQDCLNTDATGWAASWGISASVQGGNNSDCAIGNIFGGVVAGSVNNGTSGGGQIGTIFNNLTNCLFKEVFMPIVTWAADLVTKAAGISYEKSGILLSINQQSRRQCS